MNGGYGSTVRAGGAAAPGHEVVVRQVTPGEEGRAIATLTTSFAGDPVTRWAFVDSVRYLEHFSEFVTLFAGESFECGTAMVTGDYAGAALWLPPGVQQDEEPMGEFVQRAVPEHRQEALIEFLGRVDEIHPQGLHWYLPLIGVDPYRQGMGIGGALLEQTLRRCDAEGMPAYLESTSEGSRRLYERHGFEVLGTVQVADSPPLWPMYRTPR